MFFYPAFTLYGPHNAGGPQNADFLVYGSHSFLKPVSTLLWLFLVIVNIMVAKKMHFTCWESEISNFFLELRLFFEK